MVVVSFPRVEGKDWEVGGRARYLSPGWGREGVDLTAPGRLLASFLASAPGGCCHRYRRLPSPVYFPVVCSVAPA